ncbi:DNA polymerase IV [Colwellia sp. 75C3]|uniref:DNA polymerase IV n=1 Tax=Colwellia sp. 75C3 TaxID=888425 RepID=UPI0022B802C9|nr:DNA polymerase IV [Colwellia sp. 75C3]
MKDRKIIHIDMDAFFVSVEIRDRPELVNLPVAVGGSSKRRGVLSTCNYIAREFGVRSAMPTSVAMRKCPNLVLVPSRMDAYKEVSIHIREIFSRYTSIIEPLSLDEAYLDVTDCKLFKGSATLIAQDIRETIHRETGLTASAGISALKFLAKVASDYNKPNGQFVITPSEVYSFIAELPLNKISGVGKVTFEKLKLLGLEYGRDIQAVDQSVINNNFGKFGQVLYQRCQGIDDRDVETTRVRKSVGVERTFPEDIDDLDILRSILTDKLIPELKRRSEKYLHERKISKLGVKVKFNDFHQTTKDFAYTNFDEGMFLDLLTEVVKRGDGKKVRLLGVHIGLSDIEAKSQQFELSL